MSFIGILGALIEMDITLSHFFNCYLAAQLPTLSNLQGGSLIHKWTPEGP